MPIEEKEHICIEMSPKVNNMIRIIAADKD